MTIISEYAFSKNVNLINSELSDYEIVLECLKNEYGFVAPVFKDMSKVEIVSLEMSVESFALHNAYLERVEERKPTQPEIIGIVVEHDDKYRLIDGYHRFKWALNNRDKADFIFVS